LKEFDGDNQNSNELDSFIKKEKKLLEKLDELEVENIQLNNKIAELRENQGGVEKKIGEMNEILNTKNNEIKNLQKEKEKLQNQVIIFFYFVSLNFLKRFIKFSSRLRSII
jgi:septal ring factor EnvC (AmiA/AmiB activator)